MKLSFTKKMIIESIEKREDSTQVIFVSYLKEEYVERLLRITITGGAASHMYFSSNDHGTASWARNRGIVDSHRWETEDDLDKGSYLSRHYPVLIEDGAVPADFALDRIVPDVLEYMLDQDLARNIRDIVMPAGTAPEPDWETALEKYIALSDEFVSGLIAEYERRLSEMERAPARHEESRKEVKVSGSPAGTPASGEGGILSGIVGKGAKLAKSFFAPAPRQAPPPDATLTETRELLERARTLAKKIKKM